MADKPKGLQLLIGAWAVTILLLGGFMTWLLVSEPAPPADNGEPAAHATAALERPGGQASAAPKDERGRNHEDEERGDQAAAAPEAADNAEAEAAAPPSAPEEIASPIELSADLEEEGRYGLLPRIAKDGSQPSAVYASKTKAPQDMPRIALVITGLGLKEEVLKQALERLPHAVSLAFSPYGYDLKMWTSRARAEGHELLLMAPMEPLNYPANDPGPHVLLRDADAAQNIDRLHYVMSRFQGYAGVINAMGSALTASQPAMDPILEEIKKRGLIFVDARSTNYSIASREAQKLDMKWAYNNRFIDLSPSDADIRRSLTDLENTARSVGAAVGLARPLPLSIDVIAEWAATLKDRGIVLVPISAVANRQPVR